MKSMLDMVSEFHRVFNCYTETEPRIPPADVKQLRKALIEEEYKELMKAIDEDNLVEVADAIADLHYVLSGTSLAYGIPEDEVFEEVHDSNMSKANEDGTVTLREDGKVLKSARYRKPDIAAILFQAECTCYEYIGGHQMGCPFYEENPYGV